MFKTPVNIPSTDNLDALIATLPVTLNANRSRMWLPALLVLGATFFVVLSFFRNGGPVLMLWSIAQIVFSGFMIRAMFFRPLASLSVSKEGFTLSTQNNGRTVPWKDIEMFSSVSIAGAKAATYQFTAKSGLPQPQGGFTLPNQFDIQPIQLADMLEKCRRHFVGKRA